MSIKLIACDIGGVLADIDKAALSQLLGGRNQLNQFFDQKFWDLQRGKITPEEFLYFKSKFFNLDYSLLKHTFTHMITARKNCPHVLNLGIPYIFFSNINQLHFEYFLKQINFSYLAQNKSLLSFKLGLLKPQVDFFNKLEQLSNISRENILIIDDQEQNINAAIRYGFKVNKFPNNSHVMA